MLGACLICRILRQKAAKFFDSRAPLGVCRVKNAQKQGFFAFFSSIRAKPDKLLTDAYGRKLTYLRVSVTDRCNLRCVYCMPAKGVERKPHDSMLTFEETLRLCRIMTDLGIRRIKVTGGEPLVRRGTASFLKSLKALPGAERVSLTTNGFLLGGFLDEAESALPDAVNISLDALDRERFARITRTGDMAPDGLFPHIDRLLEKRVQVKINCVPVRGHNEEEIPPLAALARDRDISVRFIELMPLGSAAGLKPVPGSETAALIEQAFGSLTPFSGVEGGGPAVYYSLPGFTGKIGFINPVSRGFCETCNRLRLTSEGLLMPCLSDAAALDLRALLRRGAGDSELSLAITQTAAKKPRFHTLSPVYGARTADVKGNHSDGMFEIGG